MYEKICLFIQGWQTWAGNDSHHSKVAYRLMTLLGCSKDHSKIVSFDGLLLPSHDASRRLPKPANLSRINKFGSHIFSPILLR